MTEASERKKLWLKNKQSPNLGAFFTLNQACLLSTNGYHSRLIRNRNKICVIDMLFAEYLNSFQQFSFFTKLLPVK